MNDHSTQPSPDHQVLVSTDPAGGEEVGRVTVTSEADVRAAVSRSREVFHKWKTTRFRGRRDLIMRAREVLLSEMGDVAGLISRETGKPVAEAMAMEIAPVLDLMQWVARGAEKMLRPRRVGIGLYSMLGRSSRIVYHPWGVVAIIPAWNYPFSIPLGEAAMALMAGNSVVIKPSDLTPITGEKIGEMFAKAGAPVGLVQIVQGAGETGAALVAAAPEKIMFTGSVATGKKIARAAAENLSSVVLELGGKDPMIVFEDADLDLAARAAVWGAFCNAGQSCSSVERLYVHESVARELTDRIVAYTRELKQGDGNDPSVSIGAMTSERQLKTVEDHVEAFRRAGAKIETGGTRNSDGLFYPPTVITGAKNSMRPMQEETFGPTLPICTFTTEDEAIEFANDSEFGLTASVWSRDISRARGVAERIEAGTVCINEVLYTHGIGQTPWGGFKNSGRGRTHGELGLLELVQPQHIHTNRLAILPDAWWMPYSPQAAKTFRGFAKHFATGSVARTARLMPDLVKRLLELRRKPRR